MSANTKDYHLKRRKELSEWLSELKDKPCTDCKKRYHKCVMAFDHLPQFTKFQPISKMVLGMYSKEAILKEVAKCELVCSNCHAIRTHVTRKC